MADLARLKTGSKHCPAFAHSKRKTRPRMGSQANVVMSDMPNGSADASGHAFWSDLFVSWPKQADPVIISMPQQASKLTEPHISTTPFVARRRTGTYRRSRYIVSHANMGQGKGPGTARSKSQPATGLLWRAQGRRVRVGNGPPSGSPCVELSVQEAR